MDDDILVGCAVGLLVVFAFVILIFSFGSMRTTPEGYTDVGNHISYKCDNGSILWWDANNGRPLNPTLDDGRCK